MFLKNFAVLKMIFSNQKGTSLLLALLVLSLVVSAALGVSAILLAETKMTRTVGDSVVSLYAAETGVEAVLMQKENPSSSCQKASPCSLSNGASYYVDILTPGANCQADNFCIQSVGIYSGTRRGIEINY